MADGVAGRRGRVGRGLGEEQQLMCRVVRACTVFTVAPNQRSE